MHWPKEDSVSVFPIIKLLEGSVVGDTCSVRLGKQVHCGSILGIGKLFVPLECTAYKYSC